MFSSEIKETIYIAISCILAAAVLTLVAFVMDIRSDLAEVHNTELSSQRSMTAYQEFNKYQDNVLYGEDIMQLIREYAGSDVAIYVDELYLDERDPLKGLYLDVAKYKQDKKIASIDVLEYGKYKNELGNEVIFNELKGGITRDRTYWVYLVFDAYDEQSVKNAKYKDNGTGEKHNFFEVSAIKVLDLGEGRKAYKEVETTIDGFKNTK